MEEELEIKEEQVEDVTDDVPSTDNTVTRATEIDKILTFTPDETLDETSDDALSYVGDEDSTANDSFGEPADDNWGSLDCRSECKYNTGDRSKYANYGYSD